MYKSLLVCVIFIFLMIVFIQCDQTTPIGKTGFYAYYTKMDPKNTITGPFPDVIVNIDEKKQVVFSGQTSYLPYLATKNGEYPFDELIKRSGDGSAERPDKNNIYSYVRIIHQNQDEILIHWRYMSDMAYVDFDGVVHEYFYFTPDGRVKREVRKGEKNLIDFRDPRNKIVEETTLSETGIRTESIRNASPSKKNVPATKGNPVRQSHAIKPTLIWRFDEGLKERGYDEKDFTFQTRTMVPCKIFGNIALWKAGISGTALAFDGYKSRVSMSNGVFPREIDSWAFEGWVALGAYTWKWGAVIDLTKDNEGLSIGITDVGEIGLTYKSGETDIRIVSNEQIPLYEWTHFGVVYNKNENTVRILINGKSVNETKLDIPMLPVPDNEMVVGLNKSPDITTEHVSRDYPPEVRTPKGNQPMIYGIEGLIDEIRFYNMEVTTEQIIDSYNNLKPSDDILKNPDLEKRILPGMVDGNNAEKFGAIYTNLKYHDLWDNLWRSSDYPDIVVRFDELPASVVYWRGSNYGPGWVTENNIWMSDQSCEIYHEYGCAEHMADKQNRHSHVRIIEDHDARVVIHWRYASVDILYQFENDRIWADEYHYIYPDGTAIRYVTYHDEPTGWQDVQFLAPAGSTPEDQIDLQALTVANLKGETFKMDWSNGIPENKLEDALISIINFKSEYKVMVIYPSEVDGIGAWGEMERATPETHFAGPWNHWPISQMPNDGRYAMRTDRVTSSALGGGNPSEFAIFGFTNKNIDSLVPLGRFWNNAPEVIIRAGAKQTQFKMSEKAYEIEVQGTKVELTINSSSDSPLVNPAFVLKNWNQTTGNISVDGSNLDLSKDCRMGYRYTSEGIDLIVWIRMDREDTVNISFEK